MLQRDRRPDVWVRILLTIGIILAALVTTAPARAQVAERTTTVTAHDAATGEPIPGVAIRVGGRTVFTGTDGAAVLAPSSPADTAGISIRRRCCARAGAFT